MNRVLGYRFVVILIGYLALTYGYITAHRPAEAPLEDPPSNEEVRDR